MQKLCVNDLIMTFCYDTSGGVQQGERSLMAGAMPPTDPGPGMFPATAAAWAAAAA